jgi:hypothetical protein
VHRQEPAEAAVRRSLPSVPSPAAAMISPSMTVMVLREAKEAITET